MSYSFEEIMAYHPDNITVYNEIKQHLPRLIPFVGAGLTQFAYDSWPGALKKLSGKLTNANSKREVNSLMKAGHYLEAAQKLEEIRTPTNLAQDMAGLFSADKLEAKREQLRKEPISLLPYLFPELVLTTNFDETLETIYRESGYPFDRAFFPGNPELLRLFLIKGGTSGLLKLHGSVTGGLIEYSKIVFTEAQYDKHYGKGSLLVENLKSCFENKMMLFLGCSLESDRTMELLQEVIMPGNIYYTIINCKKSKRDEKIRQLGEKHIRAILYEDGRHEAVRVILEHLLEETNLDAYHALPVHVGALKSINLSERFSYKAEIIPFVGRERELEELHNFLSDSGVVFRWWAVIGPGGAGKSRLAYELKKQLSSDWDAHYLGQEDYADLSQLTEELTQKTLLIADYVQENAKAIGKWMEQLSEKPRSLPIRVLLVERNSGDKLEGFGWMKQLYEDVHHEKKLRDACFQETLLTLQPLCDEDLTHIMENYALAVKPGSGLPDHQRQLLLQKLKLIDLELCRPLYALFLTDAYVDGQNPERWDRDDILNFIKEREESRLKFNIKQVLGGVDKKLWTACLHLQYMATVLQDASIQDLKLLCSEAWKVIEKKEENVGSSDSLEDMLEQIGLAASGQISALQPNLMGEYAVYTWLLEHPKESQDFLIAAWGSPVSAAIFFDRMIYDYDYLLNESQKYWRLVLPEGIPLLEDVALLYARLLADATALCNIVEECERQVRLFEKIALVHSGNTAIAIEFARSLFNLSSRQDEQKALGTVKRLELLTEKYPDVPDIVIEFSHGLVNLGNKQDEQGILETVKYLERLTEKYLDVPDIAIDFAMSLFHLSNEQDKQGALYTIQRLEYLTETHHGVLDIVIWFARALANFTAKQEEQEVLGTIQRLEYLTQKYPDVPNITIAVAKGLFILSNKQDEQGALDTIQFLERLTEKHPGVPDIAVWFASALTNLTARQDEQGALDSTQRLAFLTEKYPAIQDIVVCFAKGLASLSGKQDEQSALNTTQRLENLMQKSPDVSDILDAFATGLYNFSSTQDKQGALETIRRLEQLTEQYPNVPDIAIWFANSLVNLSARQNEREIVETIRRLERLTENYPDVPNIVIAFSMGLVNITAKQNEQESLKTIQQLEHLTQKHPDVPDFAISFAKGLLNLSAKQDEPGTLDTVKRLEHLIEKYPRVLDITILFAKGLANLSSRQDEQSVLETIMRLEHLAEMHPNVPDIVAVFALGLANLSEKQDEQEALDTISRIKNLETRYPNNNEIAYYLSCAQDTFDSRYKKS